MRTITKAMMSLAVAGMIWSVPASADPGRGNGHKHHWSHAATGHCPPGLARKSPSCIPPGQARKHGIHYGNRVGERLQVANYSIIRDLRRYDLEPRRGWSYYRDDNRIYRVDSETRRILAVLNLINAFSN